jgi:hypothetical protein
VIVLDNEAVQALIDPAHVKHTGALALLEARTQRNTRAPGSVLAVVPTAVRVEACADRTDPAANALGRLRVLDVELTTVRADRAARLRTVAGGSTEDATVAEAASSCPDALVTVATSDLTDLPRLLSAAGSSARCHRV